MNEKKVKSEEEVNAEKQLDALYQVDIGDSSDSSKRISNIVVSAKREAGMRDLLTHMLFRIWIPILSIGSIIFVLFNRRKKIKK